MIGMKGTLGLMTGLLLIAPARAEVRVFVQNSNGVACINYQCTAGELVRSFALDVSVDRGQIVGISNFWRGPSTATGTGYGIFPASFRDHLTGYGTNINWNVSGYTPLAVSADLPADTLPGLNSSGVTLEFGGLWDSRVPASIPSPMGTLCVLTLSQPALVSVAPNSSRGGVTGAFPESPINPVFNGALVSASTISAALQNGSCSVHFTGGELQTAPSPEGPWTGTGNLSGDYTESIETNQTRFFRVRAP
jgi:hypothetical protein